MPLPPPPYYPPAPRPSDFGSLLAGTFHTWRDNVGAFFAVYLALSLVTTAITASLSFALFRTVATGGLGGVPGTGGLGTTNPGALLLYILVAVVLTVLVTTVVEGAMAEYSVRRFRGESMSVDRAIRRGIEKFVSIFAATLVFALILAGIIVLPFLVLLPLLAVGAPPAAVLLALLGFLVAAVVAIYVGVGLSLFGPAIMMENASAVQGLSRSWALTRGHRGSLFVAILLTAILAAVVGGVFAFVAGLTGVVAVGLIAAAVSSAITNPWLVVLTGVAYDLLARPFPHLPHGPDGRVPGAPPAGIFGAPPGMPPGDLPPPGG